jgi:hypothetical protein
LIVREAIAEYAARDQRLSRSERERLLGILGRAESRHGARLWMLNPVDFADLPGLKLYAPDK